MRQRADEAEDEVPEEGEELVPFDGHFTSLARARELPPKWVIDKLVPEGLVLIGGPPKEAKKSTLTMAIMSLVAGYKSRILPDEFIVKTPGPVMVFSYEATAGEMLYIARHELGIKVQDDDGILIANRPEEFMLDDPEARRDMLKWFAGRKPRLVVIDPLRNAHSLDEKDSGELVQILAPLRRWAKENRCAVLVVHHTRKLNESEDRPYRAADMRGSGALYGLADGVIMITPKPSPPMTFIYSCTFKRGQAWEKTITLAGYETKGQRPGEVLGQVDTLVLRSVEHGFTTLDDIAKQAKLGASTVKERLAKLVTVGRVKWTKSHGYVLTKEPT